MDLDPRHPLAVPLGAPIDAVGSSPLVVGHEVHVEHDEDVWHAEVPTAGLAFVADVDDGTIRTVQIHPRAGDLPLGLTFADDRAAVRGRLGPPSLSGEPQVLEPFGPMPAWDRYDQTGISVHVEYALDGAGIRMVSLMTDPP